MWSTMLLVISVSELWWARSVGEFDGPFGWVLNSNYASFCANKFDLLKKQGETSFFCLALWIVGYDCFECFKNLFIYSQPNIVCSISLEKNAVPKGIEILISFSRSYPLSIVLVRVGDGPWEDMKNFGDELHARECHNFKVLQ